MNEVLYLVVSISERQRQQMYDKAVHVFFNDLIKTSKNDHCVYLKDGRIFKFVAELNEADSSFVYMEHNLWNLLSDTAFENSYLEES